MAYYLMYGDKELFDPYTDNTVTDAKLTAKTNNPDYLDFTVPYGHDCYNSLQERGALVTLKWDNTTLFFGEIESIETDFEGNKSISCVGGLDWLNSTVVRPYSTIAGEAANTAPTTVDGLFAWYVEQHNSHILDSRKAFVVGVNQGANLDTNNYIYRSSTDYPNTWDEINDKIIDELGGYISCTYDPLTINLYSDIHSTNTQIIDFGINLLDYTKTVDSSSQATAVLPTGSDIYFHVRFSDTATPSTSEDISDTPKRYIGTYVDSESSDITDYPMTYSWQQYSTSRGTTGDKGIAGCMSDGTTLYLHVAWAYDSTGERGFSKTNYDGRGYIGQYVDYSIEGSSDCHTYSWEEFSPVTYDSEGKEDTSGSGVHAPNSHQGPTLDISNLADIQTEYSTDFYKLGDVVYSLSGVNRYGYIEYQYSNTDCILPKNLLTAACKVLNSLISPVTTIDVSAVDLALYMNDYDHLEVGQAVRIRSNFHDVDEYLMVESIELDLLDPSNTSYTLGGEYDTLTGQQNKYLKNLNANVNRSLDTVAAFSNDLKATAKLADSAIDQAQVAKNNADEAKGSIASAIIKYDKSIADLQEQIDGSIETWFYGHEPGLTVEPAKDWTTTEDKDKHLGDLYYNTGTGYCYRWQNQNGVYSWSRIADTDIAKALDAAKNAQDTADHKRTIFVKTPTPPYEIGDLWVQGSTGDILRCSVTRKSTETYVESDWILASKYTDDTAANAAQDTADTAVTKADGAQNTANTAVTKADTAQSTANNAVNKADAAQKSADTAIADAKNAADDAAAAQKTADDATANIVLVEKNVKTISEATDKAQDSADQAIANAATAQKKADEAYTEVGKAQSEIEQAKTAISNVDQKASDIRDTLSSEITSVKETMETDYAKTTDLTSTETTLRSEIEKSAAGITASVSQTYATKQALASTDSNVAKAQKAADANATDLANAIKKYDSEVESLQDQIDGAIETWFYDGVPTTSNAPAKDWTTDQLKKNHLGDLYYDNTTGYSYRWQIQNGVYSWARITDVDVTKALADAAKAQDTADSKRRVFITTPTPPYDKGDLWVQGDKGDIMRCQVAKTSTQSYAVTDWAKASKYTDDTAVTTLRNYVNTTYTTKSDFQILSDKVSSTVSSLETVQTDLESANTEITNAKNAAAAAQSSADAANKDLATARGELDTAKKNLTDLQSQANATDEQVAAAKKQVADAEAKVKTAQAAADAAQATADTAKEKAEKAQTDLGALTSRVTKAETDITQTNEKIELRATKTEVAEVSSTASSALSTANTANTNASSAVTTANAASKNASSAVTTANTASKNANSAVTTANTASTNASTALGTANTAKDTANSAKQTADAANTTANNAKAATDTLTVRVTTAETKITENSDAIALRATKEEVEKITIGGTNLIRNSTGNLGNASLIGTESATVSAVAVTSMTNYSGNCLKIVQSAASGRIYFDTAYFHHVSGTEYSVSFYAKGSSSTAVTVSASEGGSTVRASGSVTSSGWTKIKSTYTANTSLSLSIRASAATTFYVAMVMLETGNKPSDWSPAPEDTKSSAVSESKTYTDSQLKVTADAITASVTGTLAKSNPNWISDPYFQNGSTNSDKWGVAPATGSLTLTARDCYMNSGAIYRKVTKGQKLHMTIRGNTSGLTTGTTMNLGFRYTNTSGAWSSWAVPLVGSATHGTDVEISTTYTVPDSMDNCYFLPFIQLAVNGSSTIGKAIVTHVQIVDVTGSADYANSQIQIAKDSITSTVSKTYATQSDLSTVSNNLANNYTTTTDLKNNYATQSSLNSTNSTLDKLAYKDTRNDNQNPQWYFTNYPKQLVQEFKTCAKINLSNVGTYCYLTTYVPWSDSSGGWPKQTAKVDTDGKEYWRVATSNTAWGDWKDALGAANAAQSTANTANNTANSVKTDLATNYYTSSNVDQLADSITSTVSKTYETKTDAANTKTQVTQNANSITTLVSRANSIDTLIRESSDGIEVGKSTDGETYEGTHTLVGTDSFQIHDVNHKQMLKISSHLIDPVNYVGEISASENSGWVGIYGGNSRSATSLYSSVLASPGAVYIDAYGGNSKSASMTINSIGNASGAKLPKISIDLDGGTLNLGGKLGITDFPDGSLAQTVTITYDKMVDLISHLTPSGGSGTKTDQLASNSGSAIWVRWGNVVQGYCWLIPKYYQSTWATSPAFVTGLPKRHNAGGVETCGFVEHDCNGGISLIHITTAGELKIERRYTDITANTPICGSFFYICAD